MPQFCGVVNCSKRGQRDKVRFFRLPAIKKQGTDEERNLSLKRRKRWVQAIARADLTEVKLKYMRICENHFISGQPANLLDTTNVDWVPSINLGGENSSYNSKSTNRRHPNRKKRLLPIVAFPGPDAVIVEANFVKKEEPVIYDVDSSEMTREDINAFLDVSMNERFYSPAQVRKMSFFRRECEIVESMKNCFASQILLHTLKKQLIETEIKAATLRKDYYEKKSSLLSQLYCAEDSKEDLIDEDLEELETVKAQISEHKLASKIEKRILRSDLIAAEIRAAEIVKEYQKSKRRQRRR